MTRPDRARPSLRLGATFALALLASGCTTTPPPAPSVSARLDPDGFLYFNDAALYRSAMTRCAARLPAYADELANARTVFTDARTRYAAKGGRPDRADLARIYTRSDRELAADLARQSPAAVEAACARLATYHSRNVAAYSSI